MSTHMDKDGNALMVDVSGKEISERSATAEGSIRISPRIAAAVREKTTAKGDVLSVAQLAGIMGAKRAPDFIPLCHPLSLTGCRVYLEMSGDDSIRAECTVKTRNRTGVEMEALTGVSVALLTVYDMCKGMDKGMEITGVRLLKKSGGKSGDYDRTGG